MGIRNFRPDGAAIARAIGAGRVTLGLAALVAPRIPAVPWVGDVEARRASVKLFGRALGGRDVALGVGALFAGSSGVLRNATLAGAFADSCDAAATVAAWGQLPKRIRCAVLAVTVGSAVVGAMAAFGLSSTNP